MYNNAYFNLGGTNLKNEIILFEHEELTLKVPFTPEEETVWLNRNQMATLFGRDVKTIGKHIGNALREELDTSTVAKFATVQAEGDRTVSRDIEYYNLDMIISVGYRVKSNRGIAFRRWANHVLKEYIIRGYAINQNRMNQLDQIVKLMKRTKDNLDSEQVLSVIERYNEALNLLDDYDHESISRPEGTQPTYKLTYEECRNIIDSMKYSSKSVLFGKERDDSFKGSIGNIYQSFDGEELYTSLEEKAANLLYFVTKNHSFIDGNKRIAATIFLHFLHKNTVLLQNEKKLIEDHTLVALTIMIAESNPKEKELIISLIMNCIK